MKKIIAVLLFATTLSAPAQASGSLCYNLWEERNDLYAQAGYCFKTQLAIDRFGTDSCTIHNIDDVPLSINTKKHIAEIVQLERKEHCHMSQ